MSCIPENMNTVPDRGVPILKINTKKTNKKVGNNKKNYRYDTVWHCARQYTQLHSKCSGVLPKGYLVNK